MSKQDFLRMAESFRHAIHYLIHEAHKNGFKMIGNSLEKAERTIDEELDMRGVSRRGQDDGNGKSGKHLNWKR